MKAADLTADERQFLVESTDFEQEFWELIDGLHWAHQKTDLPKKFEMAQSVARSLLERGIMKCSIVYYDCDDGTHATVRKTIDVSPSRVYGHWDNPHFWGRNSGAGLLGYEEEGYDSRVVLAPTDLGEKILDEIFETMGHRSDGASAAASDGAAPRS
jgi:type 1 glutamine amidotransferase